MTRGQLPPAITFSIFRWKYAYVFRQRSADGPSRRQLIATAGASLGGIGLGSVALSRADSDCSGIAYQSVPLEAGSVFGTVPGERYCNVERGLADTLGVAVGDQLRIGAQSTDQAAQFPELLFTVASLYGCGPPAIVATQSDLSLLGVDGSGTGDVSTTVPHPCYETEAAAKEHHELVEVSCNEGVDSAPLAVLAPHGDFIELGTGGQAEHAAYEFQLPAWICYAANDGGGTYDRWHVSSVELSTNSFPALGSVADAGYEAALAFHGRSFDADQTPFVGIGGLATDLKVAVRDALQSAYDANGVDVPVSIYDESEREFGGTNPENVVNDVTASGEGGVQLEQPQVVRDDHGQLTAATAADAIVSALETA